MKNLLLKTALAVELLILIILAPITILLDGYENFKLELREVVAYWKDKL